MWQNTTRRIFATMLWSNIIGQVTVQEILQRCIVQNRIPQALLLSGNDGYGTMALALEFARTVNCYTPIIEGHSIVPCNACQSCTQARTMQHPNITMVSAIPPGKLDAADELRKEWIDGLYNLAKDLGRNPYGPTRMENANEIRIVQIRELSRQLSLSMTQRGRRIAIIANADDMNVSTSNAFLKTLEEPHADTTIILTTSRKDRLLQTIISRCQTIAVSALDESTIADALVTRGHHSTDDAMIAASLAQGDYIQAEQFLTEDVRSIRDTAVDLLRTTLRGKEMRPALNAAVYQIAGTKDRSRCIATLNALLLWLRDAHAIVKAGNAAQVLNLDILDPLERFAGSFAQADYDAAFRSLERAVRDIDRFVPPQLVMLTTMLEVRGILLAARLTSSS